MENNNNIENIYAIEDEELNRENEKKNTMTESQRESFVKLLAKFIR